MAAIDEESDIQLTVWIKMIARNMEILGMDTVFKVPNLSLMQETDLLKDWTSIAVVDVDEWITMLKTGVGSKPRCPYDKQNLEWSGSYILNSLTKKLHSDVTQTTGQYPYGPEVLREVINIKQQLDSTAIRVIEQELQKLCLDCEPAENVAKFTKKVKAHATKLENFKDSAGNPCVTDIAQMVAAS